MGSLSALPEQRLIGRRDEPVRLRIGTWQRIDNASLC